MVVMLSLFCLHIINYTTTADCPNRIDYYTKISVHIAAAISNFSLYGVTHGHLWSLYSVCFRLHAARCILLPGGPVREPIWLLMLLFGHSWRAVLCCWALTGQYTLCASLYGYLWFLPACCLAGHYSSLYSYDSFRLLAVHNYGVPQRAAGRLASELMIACWKGHGQYASLHGYLRFRWHAADVGVIYAPHILLPGRPGKLIAVSGACAHEARVPRLLNRVRNITLL